MVVMLINSINSHTNNYITVILDGVGLNNVQNHLSSYLVIVSLMSTWNVDKK